ncbi:phosphodiesterase [Ramlibacter tataouinensis]|uniref:Phosphoesterase n=1 Tax=Ramlibacter tataouinensis TaxID=94132 RepID=A0A127JZJ0_9BURK|nr:phosphodiesterase [Ramlibacter tataouinensis]
MLRIGLISDTHGLLRPQALEALRGCDRILHAGDVGHPAVLQDLAALAPVTAVRGNNDTGPWAQALPETDLLQLGEIRLYLLHDLAQLAIDPRVAGVRVVVSGHSHQPGIAQRDGVLYVNPGSAGPRRFKLPVAVGELAIAGPSVSPRIVPLQ